MPLLKNNPRHTPTQRLFSLGVAGLFCLVLAGCSGLQKGTDTAKSDAPTEWSVALAEQGVAVDPVLLIAATQHPFTRQAMNQLGVKYRFGGSDPKTGFDCSGLVYFSAVQGNGIKLPRRSTDQARLGQTIKKEELVLGDLVFFNTRGSRFSHVGIYLGNNQFVHAPSRNGVVTVADMSDAYWSKRFNGARRMPTLQIAAR